MSTAALPHGTHVVGVSVEQKAPPAFGKVAVTLVIDLHSSLVLFMAALCSRCVHCLFVLWFLLSSIYLFSSPSLSRRRVDVYHTSTHDGASVRIKDAGLKRAARGSLKIQDTYRQKFDILAPSHNFVGLGLYLRNLGAY